MHFYYLIVYHIIIIELLCCLILNHIVLSSLSDTVGYVVTYPVSDDVLTDFIIHGTGYDVRDREMIAYRPYSLMNNVVFSFLGMHT